ncbi:response regulator [Chitinophagaceae bacterium MMS25-I14]
MKTSFQKRLYTGFAAALMLSAVLGITSYWSTSRQAAEANLVKHTYRVVNELATIEKLLYDMETGSRGFRSTNERRFLQPYFYGRNKIIPAVENLKTLVADNEKQLKKASDLDATINRILVFWQEHNTANDKSDILLITSEEKELMDQLRVELNNMTDLEKEFLATREKKSVLANETARTIAVIGSLLAFIVISLLVSVILKEFNKRKTAEKRVLDSLSRLELLNTESAERNWMLQGVASVNDALQETGNPEKLILQILRALLKYTGLPAGAVYLYDESMEKFMLQASEGMQKDILPAFSRGENLTGKAAESKKVTVTENIPATYWQLQSAAGKAAPGTLIMLPLWYDGAQKGLVEFASFSTPAPQVISLLDAVSNNIAVALNAAEARRSILQLLEQVQDQKETLVQQQEELRQSNEELHRQAEILQASEEELRVQEEELRQINSELEERNEAVEMGRQALAQKARELEATGKYKSEFLANMSHELRTPLNSVLILANMLSENKTQNLTEKQIEYARIIHKSGNDLLNLINDILDLSKIEAGKIDFNFEDIPVKDIVQDMDHLFAVLAGEKKIHFVTEIAPELPVTLHTDKQRLGQIIKNLLSNSFKFTPANGTVTLSFQPVTGTQNKLAISVTDTGIGIAPEKQQLIFEAFQQADGSTSRKYGGTGLGLSISKELIRRLGGTIEIRSEQGKGSTFTLLLPLIQSASAPSREVNAVVESAAQPLIYNEAFIQSKVADDRMTLQPEDKTMLIIEDDPQFAAVVRDYAREKGYKTVVALQGDEGIFYARKYNPAAIILDMQLPVMDGHAVLKILKNDPELKNIPVHVISAMDVSRLSIDGALAYLQKPLKTEDLERAFSTINQFLKSSVKKVLVLSGDYLGDKSLSELIDERHFDISCDYAKTEAEAMQMIQDTRYDCVIADIGQDIANGISELQRMRDMLEQQNIPVIIYMDKTLSVADELQLKKVSDVVIRASGFAKDRLMDELELFLYKVQQDKSDPLASRPVHIADEMVLHNKKILIADDDMRNVFALSTLLEEQQMDVITAGDGREALDLLEQNQGISMVLMDIMMPEIDGYEAVKKIRANRKFAKLPVIAVTAKAMQGDYEKCMQAGFSDYITKPIDSARLLSLLRVWMS